MATALSYNAINRVEGHLENIQSLVSQWDDYNNTINATLNSEIGQRFLTEFTIGETATIKVNKVIDIILGMQENINRLVSATYEFCDDQRRANMAEE